MEAIAVARHPSDSCPAVGMEALEATIREQQLRLDSLEQQLFQSLSKQHRTGFKPVDMSPLAKLESTVRLLNDDFQRFRGTDTRQLTETICSTFQANLRRDLDSLLATKASSEDLAKFDTDVKRIETFALTVQSTFYGLKSKLEATDKDLTDRFSETRWQAMRDKLRATASEDLEGLVKEFRLDLLAKESSIQDQLKGLQGLATSLDRDVRSQYGPETLERHLTALETKLQANQRAWQAEQDATLQAKLRVMEEQSQVTKSLVLDAVALVKQELSASGLQQRYKAFEDKLADHESSARKLQEQIKALETQLQRQVIAGQERQSDLFEQVQATKDQLKPLQASIQQAQTQIQDQLKGWLKDRQAWLQTSIQETNGLLTGLQDRTLTLQDQLVLALEARKGYEEKWSSEQANFQKKAEEQITSWTTEKADYITTRIAELTLAFKATQKLTEEQQSRITDLLSEDSLQSFVKAGEAKILQVQEEWGKRRTMEFSLKFGEYDKIFQAQSKQLQDDREATLRDLSALQADIRRTQTTEFAKQLADFSRHTKTIATDLQRDVKSGLADIQHIRTEIGTLQKAYEQQTSEAITQERYAEFQKQTEDKLRTWFSERGSAIFQKFQEVSKESRAIQQATKDIQHQLQEKLSDPSIQAIFKDVEGKIIQSNESWKERMTASLQGRMDTATSFLTTSKEELDSAIATSRAEISTLETTLKESIKGALTTQQTSLNESKLALQATEQALKSSLDTYRTQQQSALDTYVQTTVSKLSTEFTAGIQRLDGAKETIQKLYSTLREQINEAVTREKYLEFQRGLQAQLDTWTASHTGELKATLNARDTQIQQALEATEKQVALWQKLLSEERLRGFIETIEKQLKTQQADWIQRRTQEYSQRYETFQALGETFKTQVQEAQKQLQTAEQAFRDRFSKQEVALQKQQTSWLQQREEQLSAVVKQVLAPIEVAEKRIATKEQYYEDQVASFKKQVQVSLQARVQELQTKWSAHEAILQAQFTSFETATTDRFTKSLQDTEQKRLALFKDTDTKLKASLQEWLTKHTGKLETLVEQTALDVSTFQESLQKENKHWIEEQTTTYTSTLERSLAKVQALFATTTLQEQTKIAVALKDAEERLLTAQEGELVLTKQTMTRQLNRLETALTQLQQSYDPQFASSLASIQELQGALETLQRDVKQLASKEKPEGFQTLLTRHKADLLTLLTPRLDQIEAIAKQAQPSQDTSAQTEALTAQQKLLQTSLTALQRQVQAISLEPLAQQLETITANIKGSEIQLKSFHKRLDTSSDQVQELKKLVEQVQQVPHFKTMDQLQRALGQQKKEVSETIEKRFTELSSVLEQIKVKTASDKPLEGLQTVLARQKDEILRQVKQQVDSAQDKLREAIPSMTVLDAYHSEKLGQYEVTLGKQLDTMRRALETLGGTLRTELDESLRSLETTKHTTLKEIQSAVRDATTVWVADKAHEFARYLEDNQEKMLLLQKALVASKDEWASQKQKEFTVRIGEALKQYQSALQTSTTKTELELQERLATLETDLTRKQLTADQTVRQTLQGQLRLIQQASEKTQQDIATLYDITRTLQAGLDQKQVNQTSSEAEALLASLSAPVQPKTKVQTKQKGFSSQQQTYTSLTKCFYTAIYAESGQSHDTLSQIKPPQGWDAICFTNVPNLVANGWNVVQFDPEQSLAVLNAKYIKWMSHRLLEDYDVTVWLDAYLSPNQQAGQALEQWISYCRANRKVLAHRAHAERKCVWEECKAVVQSKRDTPEHIASVEKRLLQLGMPKQFGLFDTNVLIKFQKEPECRSISEAIFNGLLQDTFRDQLIVTPTYFKEKFRAYVTLDLHHIVERTGTHVRMPIQ